MELHKRIATLFRRYQEGKSTAKEDELIASVLFVDTEPEDEAEREISNLYKKQVWTQLEALHTYKARREFTWYYLAAAALIIVVSSFFTLKYFISPVEHDTLETTLNLSTDIAPGGSRATLRLADGRVVNLDNKQAGIVVTADGIAYAEEGGAVIAQDLGAQEVVMVEVSTPRSGQYQITLPDGTRVWLNSATTLRYPSRFSADKRVVYLDGEAYFEVNEAALGSGGNSVASKKPFVVITQHQEAEVLGTKFNINSFEKAIKTTLASGRLNVRNGNRATVSLFPQEQSISTKDGIHKKRIDLADELAWRNNKFSFDNKPFKTIMDELGRWYNLDIEYQSAVPHVELAGDAFRNQNLSLVLRVLDASNVHYKLDKEKRKLTIY